MDAPDILEWLLNRLEALHDEPHVLVRDGLRLLPEVDGRLHAFARDRGYTMIVAATNLVFRELYEQAIADPGVTKLLVIDRAPIARRSGPAVDKAPPPFYPDLLAITPPEARIDLDLRRFLKERTQDPYWPEQVSDPRYARLITAHLPAVLQAHRQLRAVDKERFTDNDFQRIVAYAALGVPESAFKSKPAADDYWRIGLLGHDALRELDRLAPEATRIVKDALKRAPAPFRWFVDREPDDVVRAFYLSVILAQHVGKWNLLLAAIDPALAALGSVEPRVLDEAAVKLTELDPGQAHRDLLELEASLDRDALQRLNEEMGLALGKGFGTVIEHESYSTLIRSQAMLLAIDDLLAANPNKDQHKLLRGVLDASGKAGQTGKRVTRFVETRAASEWPDLLEAYRLAGEIVTIKADLAAFMRTAKVRKASEIPFGEYRAVWNEKRVNRLEYYLSVLRRLVETGILLPRPENMLPDLLPQAGIRIKANLQRIGDEIQALLDELNRYFQAMVAAHYPAWLGGSADVVLTSQFLHSCLARNWDPQKEKAVVFVFDGMRYDIWDELVRPRFEECMRIIKDLPGVSILPSATRYSRWAIAAGENPVGFWPPVAENAHLKKALTREMHYAGSVDVLDSGTHGTGETVRYRAGNLDYYIFELCDKELHHVEKKSQADGRIVPSRPLAVLYQQTIKSVVDNEVMAVVRALAPGTKVFVVADHGFGQVGDTRLWFKEQDLNEDKDCNYLYARLKTPFHQADIPKQKREAMIAFTPAQIGAPAGEEQHVRKTGQQWRDTYESYVFPKIGHALSRPNAAFRPDYFSHGGISMQEMLVPMVVLQVRQPEESAITLDDIKGPAEAVEGEETNFQVVVRAQSGRMFDEQPVELEAVILHGGESEPLGRLVVYVGSTGRDVAFPYRPAAATATDDERHAGRMERQLTITAVCREGRRTVRATRSFKFSVQLQTERVMRRVPPGLGSILGLTPKNMR